jgi:peroxiredoxin
VKYESRGVAFVGVNVHWDKEPEALQFVERFGMKYPVGHDASGAVGRGYGVEATPTTYVIDRAGRVAAATVGALEPADLDRLLESALAKS